MRYLIDQGRRRDKIIFSWWVGPKKKHFISFQISMLVQANLSNLYFIDLFIKRYFFLFSQQNNFLSVGGRWDPKKFFIDLFIKFWEICLFKHADLKEEKKIWGAPPTKRKLFCLVVYPGLSNLSNCENKSMRNLFGIFDRPG